MEFDDTSFSYPPDRHTPDEFLARQEALQALVLEATKQGDKDKLDIFRDRLAELESANPNAGLTHQRYPENQPARPPEIGPSTVASKDYPSKHLGLRGLSMYFAMSKVERSRARKRALAPSLTMDDETVDGYTPGGIKMMQAICEEEGMQLSVTRHNSWL